MSRTKLLRPRWLSRKRLAMNPDNLGLIPGSKKNGFWKLSFDQWHVHTTNTPCFQQTDLINKRDYIIHTFISFSTKLRPWWLSCSCSHLMTQTILGLSCIYFCLWLCLYITWYSPMVLFKTWLPFFFSLIFYPHQPLCYLCLPTFLWHLSDKVGNLFCREEPS